MAAGLPQFIPVFGSVGVSGLAVAAAAGLLAGAALVGVLLRRGGARSLGPALDAAALPLLLGGLAGARLGNQFLSPDLIWDQPASWVQVSGTSLSFTGGLAGAALGAWLGLRRVPAAQGLAALDALVPGLALAVAVGWLGLPAPGRLGPFPLTAAPAPPVQLFGLAGFAALAAALAWQWPRRDYPGQNAATFAVLASAFRFVLGFAQQSTPFLGPWSLTQVGDAGAALAGLALTAWLSRRAARQP